MLYLPRDATPLDFAVWNLGAKKASHHMCGNRSVRFARVQNPLRQAKVSLVSRLQGLRAEAAFIDSSEATLNTRLREAAKSMSVLSFLDRWEPGIRCAPYVPITGSDRPRALAR